MGNIYKLGDIDNEQFYILPKGLFINPKYQDISNTARIVYALLKDRMELSRQNGWHDDNGDIYLVYPSEQIEKDLNIAHSTASKVINELRTVGLIDTVRQGLGKANIIYIKKFEIHTSESMKSELQEVRNSYSNDTDVNKYTESKDTYMVAKPHNKRKPFVPPSLEEVETHISEKGYSFNAKAFIDYYEASDWHLSNGRKVANWKKCCATWENNANRYVVSKQKKQPTQADYDEWIKELEDDEVKQG
jgi:hypothetical protein